MKAYAIRSKGALFGAIGLIALLSAAVWGAISLSSSDSDLTALSTESPERVAQIREILFADEAVKGILEGRHEGRDYWMRIDMMFERENVDKTGEPSIAQVLMWFDPPVSWEGEVPTRSDPCDPYEDEEGWLRDKNHPCIREPREYGSRHEDIGPTHGITAGIDLRLGRLYAIVPMGGLPYEIRGAKELYATPGSSEQDARTREILFQHEAVKRMTAGMEEGENYWVGVIGYVFAPGEPLTSEEKTIAMVNVYFDPPLDWSGPLPTRLDPCEREREEEDGQPDLSDPCWSALPQYEVRAQEFSGGDGFYADIDLRANEVLEIAGLSAQPGEVDAAKARYAQ